MNTLPFLCSISAAVLLLACGDDVGVDGDGGNGSGSGGTTAANPTGETTGGETTGATTGATTGNTTGATTAGVTTGATDDAAQYCVDKINTYRATLGLSPYGRWASAEACSDGEAESDGNSNTPHGAFGACGEFAQNECPDWSGSYEQIMDGCLQLMWDEGPGEPFEEHGHYINMSSTQYTEVACGFHTFGDGSVWAVQNFR